MVQEDGLPKDLGHFTDLENSISLFRRKLINARSDADFLDKFAATVDDAQKWGDEFAEEVGWFTSYHTRMFSLWKIPEMVSAFKLTTKETSLPENPSAFFAAFPSIPDWRKRHSGIRAEIVKDLTKMIVGTSMERVPAKWVYLMMELIDLAEIHKGVNFGVEREYRTYVRDNPLPNGEQLPVYETLAFYVFSIMNALDPSETRRAITNFHDVANTYSQLAQNDLLFGRQN